MSTLLQFGEIGGIEPLAIDLLYDLAVGLGLGARLYPIGIGVEVLPVLLGGLAARVRQEVHESVLGLRRVLRHPVADALHSVLVEDADRVVAETRLESVELSLEARVRA